MNFILQYFNMQSFEWLCNLTKMYLVIHELLKIPKYVTKCCQGCISFHFIIYTE